MIFRCGRRCVVLIPGAFSVKRNPAGCGGWLSGGRTSGGAGGSGCLDRVALAGAAGDVDAAGQQDGDAGQRPGIGKIVEDDVADDRTQIRGE